MEEKTILDVTLNENNYVNVFGDQQYGFNNMIRGEPAFIELHTADDKIVAKTSIVPIPIDSTNQIGNNLNVKCLILN